MDHRESSGHTIRVEHRPPDGTARLLAESTMRSLAKNAAERWLMRLRQHGADGVVVLMDGATGDVVEELPLAAGAPAVRPLPIRAPPLGPEWLTIKEVAAVLGISASTVRARIKRGEVPAEQRPGGGRGLYVRRADADAAIARSRAGEPASTSTAIDRFA